MARTNDPHSATSQFFINLQDNSSLDHSSETPMGWGYAVFGEVVNGTQTVEAIAKVETGNYEGHQDVPVEEIKIIKAEIMSDE
jgi:peptidyl-prolyl cis-trans isomerase B (cyclophilin B)